MINYRDNKMKYKGSLRFEKRIFLGFLGKKISVELNACEKMARKEILVVSLILAIVVNSVACSSDEIQSDIKIVPHMAQFLIENPGLEVQQMIQSTKLSGVLPYAKIVYRIGYRIVGETLNLHFC